MDFLKVPTVPANKSARRTGIAGRRWSKTAVSAAVAFALPLILRMAQVFGLIPPDLDTDSLVGTVVASVGGLEAAVDAFVTAMWSLAAIFMRGAIAEGQS